MEVTNQERLAQPSGAGLEGSSRRLFRNLAFLGGGQVFTWGLSLVWTIIVPRLIGPVGIGQLAVVWSATALFGIVVGLGTSLLVTKEVARDRESAGKLIGGAVLLRVALGLVLWPALALYAWLTHFDSQHVLFLTLAAVATSVGLVTDVFGSALQGIERMEYLAYSNVVIKTGATVLGIVFVWIGFGVTGLLSVTLVVSVAALVMNLYWIRRYFRVAWSFRPKDYKRLAVQSLPFWASGLFLTIYIWIDTIILAVLTNDTVVGWYAVPTRLFGTLIFVPVLLATAWYPRLVVAFKEGGSRFTETLAPAIEWAVMLSFPICVGTAAVAPALTSALYGAGFSSSAPVLVILALALPATYLNILCNMALAASDRQFQWTKVMIAATVINPLINLVMIPYAQHTWGNGAAGAAISLGITEAMMATAAIVMLRRSVQLKSTLRIARAAAAAMAMAPVVWLAARYGLAAQVLLGVVMFGGLVVVLRILTADELRLLRRLPGQLRGRFGRAPVTA